MNYIEDLKKKYKETFNEEHSSIYFSPGRVNLIGEHLDYNKGHVMPFSISLGIYGIYKFNNTKEVKVCSYGFNNEEILSFNLDTFDKTDDFTLYIKSVIYILKTKYNMEIPYGFNLYIYSTLPSSSGLSSSAALELLISNILNDEFNLGFNKIELAILSKEAENIYVGVNCGIMDQFAVSMGKKDNVIFLDTNTLEYKYVPIDLTDKKLYIINTNKPRNLITSKYNERRNECDKAASLLGTDIVNSSLDEINKLPNPINKRARHVYLEEKRVIDTTKNPENIGDYLILSHESLRNDYEVTGLELDTIFDSLKDNPNVIGLRMTGAGFGGCLISIFKDIDNKKIEHIMEEANSIYKEKTGLTFSYYEATLEDGTKKLK